jgi:TrmH family RNA methyltransferase
LAEAVAAGAAVESVFVAPGGSEGHGGAAIAAAFAAGAHVYDLAPGVLERVAATVTPQAILAVVKDVSIPLDKLIGSSLVVVAVDVRDPGNAGTLLRSAEAAGVGGVVCCDGTVDITNPKCVRASAGSLFHVPVVVGGDAVTVLEHIGAWGMRRLGAAVEKGEDYITADLRPRTALVLGNETAGLPLVLDPVLDGYVHVPMSGRTESLNVGMACAVLCFEAARQRRAAERGGPE